MFTARGMTNCSPVVVLVRVTVPRYPEARAVPSRWKVRLA
jgi:hypothetical protein